MVLQVFRPAHRAILTRNLICFQNKRSQYPCLPDRHCLKGTRCTEIGLMKLPSSQDVACDRKAHSRWHVVSGSSARSRHSAHRSQEYQGLGRLGLLIGRSCSFRARNTFRGIYSLCTSLFLLLSTCLSNQNDMAYSKF